jgi:Domain of unknown function (DUF4129)
MDRRSAQAGGSSRSVTPQLGRAVAAAFGVTVLLFIVAVGSRAVPFPPGASEESTAEPTESLIAYLVVLIVPAVIAGIAVLASILLPQGRPKEAGHRRVATPFGSMRWWMRVAAVLGVIAAATTPLVFVMWGVGRAPPARPTIALSRSGAASASPRPSASSVEMARESWVVAIAVTAVAGSGIALAGSLAFRRRRPDRAETSRSTAEQFRRVLADSMADLRAEADPRRAVIAAYARMEHDLSGVGLPRRASETAPEYLRRVLIHFEVSRDAAARLTDLFERAKFGEGSVEADAKDEAIACLERVAAEVGGAGR